MSTPDVDFWSRVDIGGVPVSVGVWVYLVATPASDACILSKWVVPDREYLFLVQGATRRIRFYTMDESVAIIINRYADADFSLNSWHFVVVTYDGAGGATAMNTVTQYIDGVAVASTATNNALYVAMENLAGLTVLGAQGTTTAFYTGKLAGGPFGPFFAQAELTAAQVANLYALERLGLGV